MWIVSAPLPRTAAALRPPAPPRPVRAGRRGAALSAGLGIAALFVAIRLGLPGARLEVGHVLGDFVTLAISVVVESLPFVVLGILLSLGVQILLPADFLVRRLPRRRLPRRVLVSLLGVLLPVCECGNVPLARGLVLGRLRVDEAMTFLLAAPIVNPITIVTTYTAFHFGGGILVARVVGGFLIANLVGWLFSRHPDPMSLLTPSFAQACAVEGHAAHRGGRMRRMAHGFAEETASVLPALFVGAAVAAGIQVLVSRQVLVTLGGNPLWSVLALMALAFVVAVCSNVDAFFILSFGATFMPGAIVAFLTFGAMIDVKMVALIRTTFRWRTIAALGVVVALGCAVLGLAVNHLA